MHGMTAAEPGGQTGFRRDSAGASGVPERRQADCPQRGVRLWLPRHGIRACRPACIGTQPHDRYPATRKKPAFQVCPTAWTRLCRRFAIDLSARTSHNALLDCRLLADVYVELTGGRQRGLSLSAQERHGSVAVYVPTGPRTPRPIQPTEAELAAHAAFLARIKEPVWRQP